MKQYEHEPVFGLDVKPAPVNVGRLQWTCNKCLHNWAYLGKRDDLQPRLAWCDVCGQRTEHKVTVLT